MEKRLKEIFDESYLNKFNISHVEKNDYILKLNDKVIGKDYIEAYGFNFWIEKIVDSKVDLTCLCNFSEIQNFYPNSLINNIDFTFYDILEGKVDDSEFLISDYFKFPRLTFNGEELFFNFWFNLYIEDYKEKDNPMTRCHNYYNKLVSLNHCSDINMHVEDAIRIDFLYKVDKIDKTLKEIYDDVRKDIMATFESSFILFKNNFEAIFNFPEQYQSILKPYLLYFEEFLNDLCIETDVNIQKSGEDTILSVEPKNKDEALEKIADALKAYLCAPVIAEGISMEESFQMQTTLTKLYAQCKNLESQMMFKEVTLKEQNKQLEVKDNIINESKRVLVESGVDTNIITQNNSMLLDSLKSMKINNEEIKKSVFLKSIKTAFKVPFLFNGSLEFKRDKL